MDAIIVYNGEVGAIKPTLQPNQELPPVHANKNNTWNIIKSQGLFITE